MVQKYIAFLRGINVGGHHKIPMAELRLLLENEGYTNVSTFLNTGNVILEANAEKIKSLEDKLSTQLEEKFGFSIPVIVCEAADLLNLIHHNPFKDIEVTKDTRLYVTFLKNEPKQEVRLPLNSDDNSFKIIELVENKVCSVLDLSKTTTMDGMAFLEKAFDSEMTTRNWNTLKRIANKLEH